MEIKPLRTLILLILAPIALAATGVRVTTASFDFNDGFQGWDPLSDVNAQWVVKEIAPAGDPRSFSRFDPLDVSSLSMLVSLNSSRRAKIYVTSPLLYIDKDASLDFYVGFNKFYDTTCRLLLQVSGDDFLTSETIWNSKNAENFGSWSWQPVSISLKDFYGEEIKFRFFYTTGSTEVEADRGGFGGDFSIDNFIITADVEEKKPDNPVDPDNPDNPVDPDNPDNPDNPDDPVNPDKPDNPDDPNEDILEAKIVAPVDFFSKEEGCLVVPPAEEVTFSDGSLGNPSLVTWIFTGLNGTDEDTYLRGSSVTVAFPIEGIFKVTLVVQDDAKVSVCERQLRVADKVMVSNIPDGSLSGAFLLDGVEVLPGSNTLKISSFAERFSAPPLPVYIDGVDMLLKRRDVADALTGMMSLGVRIYSSRNGLPNVEKAASYLMINQLPEVNGKEDVFVSFIFDEPVKLEDEFFILAEGFPATTDSTAVNFGGASVEEGEGRALVKRNGEWSALSGYSFCLYPHVSFSAPSDKDGVASVFGDEQLQYYNLQGVRVDMSRRPAPGIYIVVKGNQASKVMIH